jgi:hypothetical protein
MSLYISDGQQVLGPWDAYEALTYVKGQKLDIKKWQVCDISHVWKPLEPELPNLALEAVSPKTTITVENGDKADQPGPKTKLLGLNDPVDEPGALERLAKIRVILDSLWYRQRERIVATVKNIEPSSKLRVNDKELEIIRDQMTTLMTEYWQKSGTIMEWVKKLTWGSPEEMGDYFLPLSSKDVPTKMEEVRSKLDENDLTELLGCYCFMKGREYLYIGETHDTDGDQNLGKRILTGHKNKDWWEETDGMRIIIPRNVKNAKKLERLLILAYNPKKNTADGQKSSAADDCIETIVSELEELTQT